MTDKAKNASTHEETTKETTETTETTEKETDIQLPNDQTTPAQESGGAPLEEPVPTGTHTGDEEDSGEDDD